MMRRTFFLYFAVPMRVQDSDAQQRANDFARLANDFIATWNQLMALEARGRWDVKLARECEAAFRKLTENIGWVR